MDQPTLHSGASERSLRVHALLLVAGLFTALALRAADIQEAWQLHLRGDYAGSVALARQALANHERSEDWSIVLAEGLRTLGQPEQAAAAISNAVDGGARSIRLRWIAREICLGTGDTNAANRQLEEIAGLVQARPWAYRRAPERVTFGWAALALGAPPKRVLDQVFDATRREDPELRDGHLACGRLALDKHDFALAAKSFEEGLKRLPDDPDLHFGLAQAYEPSDTAHMLTALEATLRLNSNHVGALLLLTDHQIDAEAYAEADASIARVLQVNPWHPEAWTYRAVLAQLRSNPSALSTARDMARHAWDANPRVPHLEGRKLSQHYRFTEGAELQRQALAQDPSFLAARAQLAQDLLRLGEEPEGWQLAEEVEKADPFDVAAFNLVTLRATLEGFLVLTNAHFRVRMTPKEAAVYGQDVLTLLETARAHYAQRYGIEPERPVLVEVFPEQKDFAVRTFGLPENHGFLGVCFGPVITANSPASRPGQPFNWQSMLWHEYGHVITLQLTRHRMPRWLSEGISVYEERQANTAWGERLTPRYRELLLEDQLTPLSKLSSAFMAPPSPEHLQFAYFQSSLVVEFLVHRYGFERLVAFLRELGQDLPLVEALEKTFAPLPQLDLDFSAFARDTALALAPGLDWERPPLKLLQPGSAEAAWADWARTRPTNYWALLRQAKEALAARRWTEARARLERFAALFPDARGSDSPQRLLAQALQGLGDPSAERQALARWLDLEGDDAAACRRMMELARTAGDWPAVANAAQRHLAIDPLIPAPHRYLAEAAEHLGQPRDAIAAYRALLELDPPNPAELHYRLARQLQQAGDPAARREVLLALEEAPRHRGALALLLELQTPQAPTSTPVAPPQTPPAKAPTTSPRAAL